MSADRGEEDPRLPDQAISQTVPDRSISVSNNRVDSRALFHGVREITIAHGGETYRLRLTAQNKLILTK